MIKVITLTVGALSTNCYLVYDAESKDAIVLDPGDSALYIEDKIRDADLNPSAVVLTHGHYDHLLAALEISLAYDIPICLNNRDIFLQKKAAKTAQYFGGTGESLQPITTLNLEKTVHPKIGNSKVKIMEIPGHTPGSVALYMKNDGFLFSGDLLFDDGTYGDTSHEYSDKKEFARSLKQILRLPKETIVYPGHGKAFLLKDFQIKKL
jgi:hydroxyacylglutathione hydrolase